MKIWKRKSLSRWWQLKDFVFSPRKLGKMNPFWLIFFGNVDSTNQLFDGVISRVFFVNFVGCVSNNYIGSVFFRQITSTEKSSKRLRSFKRMPFRRKTNPSWKSARLHNGEGAWRDSEGPDKDAGQGLNAGWQGAWKDSKGQSTPEGQQEHKRRSSTVGAVAEQERLPKKRYAAHPRLQEGVWDMEALELLKKAMVKVWVISYAGKVQGHRVMQKCDWLAEEGLVHHCTTAKSKTGSSGKVACIQRTPGSKQGVPSGG